MCLIARTLAFAIISLNLLSLNEDIYQSNACCINFLCRLIDFTNRLILLMPPMLLLLCGKLYLYEYNFGDKAIASSNVSSILSFTGPIKTEQPPIMLRRV